MSEQKERRVRRLLQPDAWDIPGMESWLADMAARGLYFREKGDAFVLFTKCTPKTVLLYGDSYARG